MGRGWLRDWINVSLLLLAAAEKDCHCEDVEYTGPFDGLRMYVFPLPDKYNVDLVQAVRKDKKVADWVLDPSKSGAQYGHEQSLIDALANEQQLLTSDPALADIFIVPYHSSLAKWLGQYGHGIDQDLGSKMDDEVQDILFASPFWQRNSGKDFLAAIGYPWGSLFGHYRFGRYSDWIVAVCDTWMQERTTEWPHYHRHIIVPYYDHRNITLTGAELEKLYPLAKRDVFACFVGSTTKFPTRRVLKKQFKDFESMYPTRHLNASAHPWRLPVVFTDDLKGRHVDVGLLDVYKRSVFCIVPAGDTAQTKRLFDAIRDHCIPVLLSDNVFLPSISVLDWSQFTVRVHTDTLEQINVPELLASLPLSEIQMLHDHVVQASKHFIWHKSVEDDDAVYMFLRELQERVLILRQWADVRNNKVANEEQLAQFRDELQEWNQLKLPV